MIQVLFIYFCSVFLDMVVTDLKSQHFGDKGRKIISLRPIWVAESVLSQPAW